MEKLEIHPPKGHVIDKERSDLDRGIIYYKEIKRWKPEYGEMYRYVSRKGSIYPCCWENDEIDIFCYNQRNCFKTEKEAQDHLDKLNTIAQIRDRIEELNEGWVPDWIDLDQNKNYLHKNQKTETFKVDSSVWNQNLESWKYFRSVEIGEQLIKEFGAKLNVLFE